MKGSVVFDLTIIVGFDSGHETHADGLRVFVEGVNPPEHVPGFDMVDGEPFSDWLYTSEEHAEEREALDWVVRTIEVGGAKQLAEAVLKHIEDERNRRRAREAVRELQEHESHRDLGRALLPVDEEAEPA